MMDRKELIRKIKEKAEVARNRVDIPGPEDLEVHQTVRPRDYRMEDQFR